MALPRGPAQELLEKLDGVFGPEYFERGRLLITVARDVAGTMKVAHRLQSRINESLGSMVEIIFEHVKHELWARLHEATTTVGLHKGAEVPECQVTHIPEGVRTNPYQRERLPTLEVLLLWEDSTRTTRGHCLYSMAHPESPSVDQVDAIFGQIAPFFAKRWVFLDLALGEAARGSFEEDDGAGQAAAAHDGYVGPGVEVTLLACHAYGFAGGGQSESMAPHVRHCQPLAFRSISDDAGRAKVCFLPAEINKVQVAESERFHGAEVSLPRASLSSLDQGPTLLSIRLTPKALAAITVHVFALPRILPKSDEADGIVDWAREDLEPVQGASLSVSQLRDGELPLELISFDEGVTFVAEDGFLPEGAVHLHLRCPGFEPEDRPLFLLVGLNEFYVPLRRLE